MEFKPENLINFFKVNDERSCFRCGNGKTIIERFIHTGRIEVHHKCSECGFVWKTKYGLTKIYDEILEEYCGD